MMNGETTYRCASKVLHFRASFDKLLFGLLYKQLTMKKRILTQLSCCFLDKHL